MKTMTATLIAQLQNQQPPKPQKINSSVLAVQTTLALIAKLENRALIHHASTGLHVSTPKTSPTTFANAQRMSKELTLSLVKTVKLWSHAATILV
jgi:hypothetical protein